MRLTWLGHAAVLLEGSRTVIIDPFLSDNPSAVSGWPDLPHVDFIAVTHEHFDHLGDAVAIGQRDHSTVVALADLCDRDDIRKANLETMGLNIGGRVTIDGIGFGLTPAVHGVAHGSPTGIIVEMDGWRIYHAGDTAYFSDMSLLKEMFGPIDLACLPIGGHYAMDVKQAQMAIRALQPKQVLPIHFNTWPNIAANPALLGTNDPTVKIVSAMVGQSLELERN